MRPSLISQINQYLWPVSLWTSVIYNIGYFVGHRFVDVSSKIKLHSLRKYISWTSNIQIIEYNELILTNPFCKVIIQSLNYFTENTGMLRRQTCLVQKIQAHVLYE